MRTRAIAFALLVVGSGLGVPLAGAQSLADVARQENERRKAVKEPAKTFTNEDLPNAPASSNASNTPSTAPSTDAAATPAPGGAAAADAAAATDAAPAAAPAGPVKDQKYWATKMKTLRDTLAQNQVLSDAMQSRINGLSTDFVNRDDPAQRAVIAGERQKALDESARLKQAIVDNTKAIADLEEEARKANVPPGWLR
jgi:hypothetical protein